MKSKKQTISLLALVALAITSPLALATSPVSKRINVICANTAGSLAITAYTGNPNGSLTITDVFGKQTNDSVYGTLDLNAVGTLKMNGAPSYLQLYRDIYGRLYCNVWIAGFSSLFYCSSSIQ